jgi:hypothetical protein
MKDKENVVNLKIVKRREAKPKESYTFEDVIRQAAIMAHSILNGRPLVCPNCGKKTPMLKFDPQGSVRCESCMPRTITTNKGTITEKDIAKRVRQLMRKEREALPKCPKCKKRRGESLLVKGPEKTVIGCHDCLKTKKGEFRKLMRELRHAVHAITHAPNWTQKMLLEARTWCLTSEIDELFDQAYDEKANGSSNLDVTR